MKLINDKEMILVENLKYRLINYFDVWGNQEDGYEVNNLCSEGELFLAGDYTKKDIIAALIDFGFFKPTVTEEMVEIDDMYDMIEFFDSHNYMPIGRLELIYD